ncbi:MAG: hypothetical protein HYY37_02940 [Candidatus Aenigmarchaeota archaeon]|nr:hypothetical protein [Candidatus Aenigmarchaeota archaeon]
MWHENGAPYGDLHRYGMEEEVPLVRATEGRRKGAYMVPDDKKPDEGEGTFPSGADFYNIRDSELGLRG